MRSISFFLSLLLPLCLAPPAFAGNWHYNANGGFGIYYAEGWSVQENGRSSQVEGPLTDSARSAIFLGSDWQGGIETLENLTSYIARTEARPLEPIEISGLKGYRVGSKAHGKYYVLRQPKNFIFVEYELRGSKEQIEEGTTSLSSIDIRTRGIEYPPRREPQPTRTHLSR